MSAISNKVFRRMEDDQIRTSLQAMLASCSAADLGVVYAAFRVRSPEWMRDQIISVALGTNPEATRELDTLIDKSRSERSDAVTKAQVDAMLETRPMSEIIEELPPEMREVIKNQGIPKEGEDDA